MRRSSIFVALLLAASCARVKPPAADFTIPRAMAPEEARKAAEKEPDPARAADLAWIEGNDRALARKALDAGLAKNPRDASLLLRRALLSEQELDLAGARRDLIAILRDAPGSDEADAAVAHLFSLIDDDVSARAEIAEGLAPMISVQPERRAFSPQLMALVTLLRGRLAPRSETGTWRDRGGWITEAQTVGPLAARMQASLRLTTQHETERIKSGAIHRGIEALIRKPAPGYLAIEPATGGLDGLYVVESYVNLGPPAATGPVAMTVFLSSPGRVRVDGTVVLERRIDDPPSASHHTINVDLAPGWHRVAAAFLAGPGEAVRISMLGADGRPVILEQRATSPQDAPFAETIKFSGAPRSGFDRAVEKALGDPRKELALRVYGASFALSALRGDLDRARALLRPLVTYAPESAAVHSLEARLGAAEGLPASQVQASLRRALAQDPLLPRALVRLGRSIESESPDQALLLADRARAAAPKSPDPDLLRFRILRARHWNAEAEESLKAALAKDPRPQVMDEAARFYRQQLRIAEAQALEKKLIELGGPGSGPRAVTAALNAGDPDRAVALMMAAVKISERPVELLGRIAQLELARKKPENAAQPIERALEIDPYDSNALVLKAITAAMRGDKKSASEALETLRKIGNADFDLELFAAQIEGRPPMMLGEWLDKTLEVDARKIALAPMDPRFADDKRVRLLEQIVDTVRPDGWALSQTHSIVRLQTKEATDLAGEFQLPGGALPLEMRTLKADGRVIEVDRHEGKADLSFSALAPGDTVELKWLSYNSPASAFGGYVRRFYFQTDVPGRRTELAVSVPKNMPVWTHSYHGAPKPTVREEGDRKIYLFRADDVPGLPGEPSVAPYEEFLPFVVIAAGIDEAMALEANAAPLQGLARSSRDLETLAKTLVEGVKNDEEKVARIYRWAIQNVRHGDFADPSVVLATKRGDRTGLIVAMLRAAGIKADMVLAQPGNAARVDPPYPDSDRFGAVLARAEIGDKVLWIRASGQTPWFGQAPPEFDGGSYVYFADRDKTPAVVPFESAEIAKWTIESKVSLVLGEDGIARGTVRLTLPGQLGQGVRHALRPLRAEDRDRAIQGWLSGVIAGSQLEQMSLEGLDDESAPFTLEAQILVAGLFHNEGGAWVANKFFQEPIGMRAIGVRPLEAYIRVSSRKMPLFIPAASERMEVEVAFPAGTKQPVEAPESFEKTAPFAQIEQRFVWDDATRRAKLILVEDIHASRIAVDRFSEFRAYVQEVTLRTRNQIAVR